MSDDRLTPADLAHVRALRDVAASIGPNIVSALLRHIESVEQERDALREDRDRLRWGVVANAGRLSQKRAPRWAHVADATSNGSTVSYRLCREAGFDPDAPCGGDNADDDLAEVPRG